MNAISFLRQGAWRKCLHVLLLVSSGVLAVDALFRSISLLGNNPYTWLAWTILAGGVLSLVSGHVFRFRVPAPEIISLPAAIASLIVYLIIKMSQENENTPWLATIMLCSFMICVPSLDAFESEPALKQRMFSIVDDGMVLTLVLVSSVFIPLMINVSNLVSLSWLMPVFVLCITAAFAAISAFFFLHHERKEIHHLQFHPLVILRGFLIILGFTLFAVSVYGLGWILGELYPSEFIYAVIPRISISAVITVMMILGVLLGSSTAMFMGLSKGKPWRLMVGTGIIGLAIMVPLGLLFQGIEQDWPAIGAGAMFLIAGSISGFLLQLVDYFYKKGAIKREDLTFKENNS